MIYLKLTGIALITFSAILLNTNYIKQIKNSTERIRQILLMIDYIEIAIKFQNQNIKSIFVAMSNSKNYNLLPFINDFANCNSESYSNLYINSYNAKAIYSQNTLELLNGFFSMLGKSDTDGQILNCETYKEFFKEELSKSEKNEESKIKIGTSLILGITVLIIILII